MFKLIQGFTKYEISDTGIIRNVKTKMIVSKEKDGKTCRMIDDQGKRRSVKIADIKTVEEKESSVKKAFDELKKATGTESKTTLKKLIDRQSKKKGKISQEDADEIRSLYLNQKMLQKDIAKKYSVHASTISEIINFKIKKK